MCVCLNIDLIQDNCSLLIELIIIDGYIIWIKENLTIIAEKYLFSIVSQQISSGRLLLVVMSG